MMDNWNDGETIQNEAGGGHMEEDTGAVTSATATGVTDNAKCGGAATCSWIYFPNSSVLAIVSGPAPASGVISLGTEATRLPSINHWTSFGGRRPFHGLSSRLRKRAHPRQYNERQPAGRRPLSWRDA